MSENETSCEIVPVFPFAPEEEAVQLDRVSEYRAYMKVMKHERPDPRVSMRVAVYIRYFNTTEHENYPSS